MENLFKPFVFIESLIGGGKTTFIKEIGKRLNFRIMQEAVDDNPYLELFYKDPKRYAFPMQIYLLHRRYLAHQLGTYEAFGFNGYDGVAYDRCIFGDYIFAKLHKEEGNISEIDFKTYELALAVMSRAISPPSLLIYLDVQPQTAYERMKKRSRNAEAGVPIDYLIKLKNGYTDLIEKAEKGMLPWGSKINVCRIVWDFDIHEEKEWDNIAITVKEACHIIK